MKTSWKDIFMYTLAALVVTYSFVWLYILLFVEMPLQNREVINLLSGQVVVAGYLIVLNYMFGTSKSSADKDKTIDRKLNGYHNEIKENYNTLEEPKPPIV